MTRTDCREPIPLDALIAYQQGELTGADEARVEEHLFACGACADRLAELDALRAGVAELVRAGRVETGASARLVDRARDRGMRIRTYRLDQGDTVRCTCSPTDDVVAVYLATDAAENERIDLDIEAKDVATGAVERVARENVVVDRATGEVIVLHPGDAIRALPRSVVRMQLRATGPAGERTLGPYILDHTPWDELDT